MKIALRASAIFVAWALACALEHLVVGYARYEYFAGAWEIMVMRRCALPIAIAALAPVAIVFAALAEPVARAPESRAARASCAVASAIFAASVAYGVSFGRHFANAGARGAFVAALGAAGFAIAWTALPRAVRLLRGKDAWLVAIGSSCAAAAWCADDARKSAKSAA
jgi:hypothetical protein